MQIVGSTLNFFFVFVSSLFSLAHHKKKYTHTLNIPKIKDYIAFPFGLGYMGRFLGAHYQIHYGAIRMSLRNK
jgi:hypothetical protein